MSSLIIKRDTPYKNVMVIGRARHGKDTVAGMLRVLDDNFERVAFADQLKDHLAEALSRSAHDLFPMETSIGLTKKFFLSEFKHNKAQYRPMLQWFGTDFVRNFDDEFWIKALDKKINKDAEGERHVLTDARFPNEVNHQLQKDYFVIKVERAVENISESNHASENQIDSLPHHIVIRNDGSIGDLFNKVKGVYDAFLKV